MIEKTVLFFTNLVSCLMIVNIIFVFLQNTSKYC